jgi:hypothetical protein
MEDFQQTIYLVRLLLFPERLGEGGQDHDRVDWDESYSTSSFRSGIVLLNFFQIPHLFAAGQTQIPFPLRARVRVRGDMKDSSLCKSRRLAALQLIVYQST